MSRTSLRSHLTLDLTYSKLITRSSTCMPTPCRDSDVTPILTFVHKLKTVLESGQQRTQKLINKNTDSKRIMLNLKGLQLFDK